jgi:NAD(P)-dependent dehydrogenase (short-subunit alcohol dehydrogenase family)
MERRSALALVAALLAGYALAVPAAAVTVLVTGANAGLGLELVKEYAAKGRTVIATHRPDGVPESLAPVIAEHTGVTVLLLHPGAVLTERQAHLTFPGMIQMNGTTAPW